VHCTVYLPERSSRRRSNHRRYRKEDLYSTDSDDRALTSRRHSRRITDRNGYWPPSTANDGRGPTTAYEDPSSRGGQHNGLDEQPLPEMYFEPTFTQPIWGGVGYGSVHNRGVQNVPSMSTVGVQYTVDHTGARVPVATVPAGHFYQHSSPGGVQFAAGVTGQYWSMLFVQCVR